jgi:single-strand DNA-binding protein
MRGSIVASSLNKVMLIGNLGRDPEIRSTNDGKEIATLNIATSETWKDRATGDKKEKTEWHRVIIFNEALVGVAKNYLKKGSRVYIEGSLQTRKWVDNMGQEKYTTEIVLQNYGVQLVLLDGRTQTPSQFDTMPKNNNTNFDHSELDDEIPF